MNHTFSSPVTAAQRQRDTLLGALVGLARSTVNEPKTEDTDRILAAGLRLAADPEAAESALLRMTDIVEAEKHRVAPNCAACAMPCGNTSNYDPARLWGAPAEICALKVRLLSAVCVLAGQKTTAQIQKEICDDLFVLAEDWDAVHRHTGRGTVRPVTFPETKKHFLPENEPFFTKPLYKCAAKNYYIVICCCLMQSFSTGAFRYYSHTQNDMRKKVESMSVKKPVVPAAAEAPAAEAKPARKTAKSAVKTEKAPKTEKTAHKGRPPLSPEIYVEFAGKQYNITDLVDRAKADYRLTHKVGVQSCKIYVKPEEEAAYYVVNKVGGKLPL